MSATPRPTVEPTHPCVRCGVAVPLDVALCEYCNPLGLPQPASSQVHGTVFVAVFVAVAALAILGRLALSGIGPFSGRVVDVATSGAALDVTLSVTNEGESAGAATCRIYDPAQGEALGPDSAFVTSPRIPAGGTVAFLERITELGGQERQLAVACTGP
ncbi:MAG: hypothetical protein RL338_1030 [Chloroflexota bacterium]